MNKIVLFFTVMLITLSSYATPLSDAHSYKNKNHSYALLFTSDNYEEIRLAAKSVYQDTEFDLRLVDLAELRLNEIYNGTSKLHIDTAAWCARVLDKHGTLKHLPILQDILNKKIDGKLKSYIEKAITQIEKRNTKDSSRLPVIDIKKLRNELLEIPQDLKEAPKSVSIQKGDDIDDVYAILGLPVQVKVLHKSVSRPFVGRVQFTHLEGSFSKFGTVAFERGEGEKNSWIVVGYSKNAGLTKAVLADENGRYINAIYSSDPQQIRKIASEIYKNKKFDEQILDHLAERLLTQKDLNDSAMEDGMAWLCRVLGASSNARYFETIKNTAQNSKSSKVRKFANKAMKQFTPGDQPQYKQGMVSK